MRIRRPIGPIAALPLIAWIGAAACSIDPSDRSPAEEEMASHADAHSHARPDQVVVRHLDLDIQVDFEGKAISGRASLQIENRTGADQLILDSKDLAIRAVRLDDGSEESAFELGPEDPSQPWMGQSLTIPVQADTRQVHIEYSSDPKAEALQWLEPEQTAGKKHPFLLSQSQAILARSWIPCQDTPSVRMTYSAKVQVPPQLMAVMSASNPTQLDPQGIYSFDMPQPIPSYLLAIAVGDLEFRSLGPRSGVYAEPSTVDAAAWELADTEKMISAAEKLYGPYLWDRYDMIVLPPSFPFGGMENPRLTFLTPTLIAGDRSLVSVIAHELAHSWSGNLVTDATWNDFWLNEGFTTYFEHRIMEEVYGDAYQEMLAVLDLQGLRESLRSEFAGNERDTWLFLDLAGRNPDEGMNPIAYDKGHFFLRLIEETVGRERWDQYLRGYFERFAFRSIDTPQFLADLRENLIQGDSALEEELQLDAWIYGPGLPDNCPAPVSAALVQVMSQIDALAAGTSAKQLQTSDWSTHHWLYFLRSLPSTSLNRMAELDEAFGFTSSRNSEILHDWLLLSIENGYEAADDSLEGFLIRQGRRKFLLPLYRALAASDDGMAKARRIYEKARPGYHPVSRSSIDALLQ